MFEIILPSSPAEWLPLIAPLATLLLGFLYFLVPGRMLQFIGLVSRGRGGAGEGRSGFAGFLIGLPVAAILFDQPVLHQTIGVAWALVALGKVVLIIFDRAFGISNFVRLAVSLALGGLVYQQFGLPESEFIMPTGLPGIVTASVAAITIVYAVVAFLLPRLVMAMMRLQENGLVPGAVGEIRGAPAGFPMAAGLAALLFGGIFVELALGVAWLVTAFGRMISMLSDGANNPLNWLRLLIELALGALPLAAVFGLIV